LVSAQILRNSFWKYNFEMLYWKIIKKIFLKIHLSTLKKFPTILDKSSIWIMLINAFLEYFFSVLFGSRPQMNQLSKIKMWRMLSNRFQLVVGLFQNGVADHQVLLDRKMESRKWNSKNQKLVKQKWKHSLVPRLKRMMN